VTLLGQAAMPLYYYKIQQKLFIEIKYIQGYNIIGADMVAESYYRSFACGKDDEIAS